jgi:hypothetical protein
MKQKELKPREAMIQRLQKKYPHLNVRLGTSADPEVSFVLINFCPGSMRPKAPLQREISDTEANKKVKGKWRTRRIM